MRRAASKISCRAAVIERHGQCQPSIVGGQRFRLDDQRYDVRLEIVPFANDSDPDPVGVELGQILRMKRLSKPISIATSSGGRLQFSDEKL